MQMIFLVFHILFCVLLMLVVLIQSGKSGGLSGIFGSGSSDALFSAPSGSSFIRKLTAGLAAAFVLTSLSLTYMAAHRGMRTVTRNFPMQQAPAVPPAPAAPAAPPTK